MKTVALSSIGDMKLNFNKSTVDLNDVLAVKHMLENVGIKVNLFNTDNTEIAYKADILFLKCGVIVNWGGQQTENLKSLIDLVNNFDGPVFMMSVDQDFVFPNSEREGFKSIVRPVYFLYSGEDHKEQALKQMKGFEIADSFQFYQGVQIGKDLISEPFLNVIPQYDAIYGGQARKELLKTLELISRKYSLVTYAGIRKKLDKSIHLPVNFNFDSKELRVVNSLGKHSFLFYKPKTPWLTPRIFEQLDSNSMVLFDTRWKATELFWTDKNTFSSQDELMDLMEYEPTEKDIKEQHKLSLAFDYDKYNEEQISHIIQLLE